MARWVHAVRTGTEDHLVFWCGRTTTATEDDGTRLPSPVSTTGRVCPDCEAAYRFETETDETAYP